MIGITKLARASEQDDFGGLIENNLKPLDIFPPHLIYACAGCTGGSSRALEFNTENDWMILDPDSPAIPDAFRVAVVLRPGQAR
jgi:hypothetical protein